MLCLDCVVRDRDMDRAWIIGDYRQRDEETKRNRDRVVILCTDERQNQREKQSDDSLPGLD